MKSLLLICLFKILLWADTNTTLYEYVQKKDSYEYYKAYYQLYNLSPSTEQNSTLDTTKIKIYNEENRKFLENKQDPYYLNMQFGINQIAVGIGVGSYEFGLSFGQLGIVTTRGIIVELAVYVKSYTNSDDTGFYALYSLGRTLTSTSYPNASFGLGYKFDFLRYFYFDADAKAGAASDFSTFIYPTVSAKLAFGLRF